MKTLNLLALFAAMTYVPAYASANPVPGQDQVLDRPVEVILYDAETVRRINQRGVSTSQTIPTPTPSESTVQPPVRETSRVIPQPVNVQEPLAMSNTPRDLTPLFSRTVKGIPIIDNPPACGLSGPEIKITAYNPDRVRGKIVADLHNHIEEDFLDSKKVVLRVMVPVEADETTFCIPVTQTGDYAFAIYHDKNSNEKWDKNFLGIPKERFGISNNPKYGMQAPDFQESLFNVPATGAIQRIRLTGSSEVLAGNRDK